MPKPKARKTRKVKLEPRGPLGGYYKREHAKVAPYLKIHEEPGFTKPVLDEIRSAIVATSKGEVEPPSRVFLTKLGELLGWDPSRIKDVRSTELPDDTPRTRAYSIMLEPKPGKIAFFHVSWSDPRDSFKGRVFDLIDKTYSEYKRPPVPIVQDGSGLSPPRDGRRDGII